MVQLSDKAILEKIIQGEVKARDGLLEIIDRSRGTLTALECQMLDFKEKVHLNRVEAIAELAKDVLGFSNADGGILMLGITDDLRIVGHEKVDPRDLINSLGPYIGTRVLLATYFGPFRRFDLAHLGSL